MRYSELIEEFRAAPFVRLLLPLLLGIVWQTQVVPFSFSLLPVVAVFFLGYLLLCIFVQSYLWRWIYGVPLFCFLFFLGAWAQQNTPKQSALPQNTAVKVLAVVNDDPGKGLRFTKYTLAAKAWVDSSGNVHPVDEKLFVYLRNQDSAALPQLGDEVIFGAVLQKIPPPKNPHEFDYAGYLRRQAIFCSAFVSPQNCVVTGTEQLSWFAMFYKTLRKKSLQYLEQTGIVGEELAVLKALTLGDRSMIDSDLSNAYAASGATHILSVSGSHVITIAMILSFVLLPLKKRKYGNITSGAIVLFFLWIYALIAGMVPPVLRATLMFSLMTLGDMLGRKGNTYNNLAFAAFLLCALDPNVLYDVGFQLSFMAVLSIVFFHPRIYKLLFFKNKIADGLWGMIAIAIAANIGTFPIVVFAFHQFPLYFVLTNVLITLPVTGIMVLFLAVLFLSWIPFVGTALCFLLNWNIMLLNFLIRTVESTPGNLIDGLWISSLQVWALLGLIVAWSLWLWTRQRRLILVSLALLAVFFALRAQLVHERLQQRQMAVFCIKGTTSVAFLNGHNSFALCDSADLYTNFDFHLKNYMSYFGLGSLNELPKVALQDLPALSDPQHGIYHSYIDYFGKTVKILASEEYVEYTQKVQVDFLIITSLCDWQPRQVFAVYQPQMVVLDASLSRTTHRKFANYLNSSQLRFHSVQEQGAYLCGF